MYIYSSTRVPEEPVGVRRVSLLRLSLLRFADSRFSGKTPMDMRIPPLKTKIMLESNPLKSRILVRRLAVLQRCVVCLSTVSRSSASDGSSCFCEVQWSCRRARVPTLRTLTRHSLIRTCLDRPLSICYIYRYVYKQGREDLV